MLKVKYNMHKVSVRLDLSFKVYAVKDLNLENLLLKQTESQKTILKQRRVG